MAGWWNGPGSRVTDATLKLLPVITYILAAINWPSLTSLLPGCLQIYVLVDGRIPIKIGFQKEIKEAFSCSSMSK